MIVKKRNYYCIDCLYAQDNKSRLSDLLNQNTWMTREQKLNRCLLENKNRQIKYMCRRKGFYGTIEEFQVKKICSFFFKKINGISFEEQEHYIDQALQRRQIRINIGCLIIMTVITILMAFIALISFYINLI